MRLFSVFSLQRTTASCVKNATEVLEIVNSISRASKEQAEAMGQVSEGLVKISNVVQSNYAVSKKTAVVSEELNSQTEMLQQLVSYFKRRKGLL